MTTLYQIQIDIMDLLSKPCAGSECFEKRFKRKSCKYENKCARFGGSGREYTTQYSHIYYVRLAKMGERVKTKAERLWGRKCEENLAGLSSKRGEECCIMGTIFKQMELKPSILKEISAQNHLVPQPARVKYVSATDHLILEDNMQRVVLTWKHPESSPAEELVTGVVVGLLGRERKKGEFEVEDVCYPDLPQQEALPEGRVTEDKYVMLVSGLNLGSSWCDQLSLEMMVDYVTGQLGSVKDQELSSAIVRVIIAGDSITNKPIKSSIAEKDPQPRFLSRNYSAESIDAMKELDVVLTYLASCVPVDLMAGSHDPTNHQLPQKPMHPCMYPKATHGTNLRGVTNPYHASFDGVNFLGCSGQNVSDIYRFITVNDRMRILENTLHWNHLSPTSPDTLACFPYYDDDPFIIEECPHVYFTGNQPKFQTKHIQAAGGQTVLLICVPVFDLTHSCVLVNLKTLDCQEITFATSLNTVLNPELKRQREIEAELEGPLLLSQLLPQEEMSILHHMDQDENFED